MRQKAETVLAVVVGIVAVLAIGAGVVAGIRGAPQLPSSSPEASVRDYLSHVLEHDLQAATDQLDPDGACTLTDLQSTAPTEMTRALLRDSTVTGDHATVRIDLVYETSGGRFGGSWVEPVTFHLVDTGERWLITGRPWPMFECGLGDKP